MKTNPDKKDDKASESDPISGYPLYSADEDIYTMEKKEPLSETEDSSLDIGLDVPGAELDDAEEVTGGEDEENNYYSLGGDDHNNLDEQ
ncbi:MAG: hypothetical protein NTW10_04400 [Bacteroidetes bacterium]|nr:hypothetical protein [Bacteroidota bacterium]